MSYAQKVILSALILFSAQQSFASQCAVTQYVATGWKTRAYEYFNKNTKDFVECKEKTLEALSDLRSKGWPDQDIYIDSDYTIGNHHETGTLVSFVVRPNSLGQNKCEYRGETTVLFEEGKLAMRRASTENKVWPNGNTGIDVCIENTLKKYEEKVSMGKPFGAILVHFSDSNSNLKGQMNFVTHLRDGYAFQKFLRDEFRIGNQ